MIIPTKTKEVAKTSFLESVEVAINAKEEILLPIFL